MSDLKELQKLSNNQTWLLDEFVNLANEILPRFVNASKNNQKISDEVNARLIRHYTTQRMLDQPEKSGRNAAYTYRHLLQLLVVRRLLSKNISAAAIGNLPLQRSNAELESILSETAQLNFTPASVDIQWERKEITQGLEINIRSDFNFYAQTEEQLLAKIAQALRQVQRLRGINVMDEALDKGIEQIFENFKAFLNHPVSKERNQEWEESKEGWHHHALIHMTYWVLRDRRQLNDIKAKAEITNQTKGQLKEMLLKIAPELEVTVTQVFKRFNNIFGQQFTEDEQEEWRQSEDGWERMVLRKMLYSLFRKRELEHEEAWFLTDKPIPQLKKRLLELAPELYQKLPGETEQMINPKKLKWTKNINNQYGDKWGTDIEVNKEFDLRWKKQASANANKPQEGDLIILRQRARVTHIVEVLDECTQDYEDNADNPYPDFSIYRWVKVVWRFPNFETAPHQDKVFGFDLNLQGGKAIDLDNITGIENNFDDLEAFQNNVVKVLCLKA